MSQSFEVILEQVEQVAKAKGKAKESVLSLTPNAEESIKPVINLALNPAITFGVGKKTITRIEKCTATGEDDLTIDKAMPLLNALQARELTGTSAVNAMQEVREAHSQDSWELLKRILVKDLRGGFSAETANRVWPEFIYLFRVQLAHKYEAKKVKQWPVDGEVKQDGVRCAAEIDMTAKTVTMLSREGNEFTTFNALKGDVLGLISAALPNAIGKFYFDGEIKSGEFNKTAGDIHRKDTDITDAYFHIFEFLTYNEFWGKAKELPIAEVRRNRLQAVFKKAGAKLTLPVDLNIPGVSPKVGHGAKWMNLILVDQYEIENHEAALAFFDHFLSKGEEGAIIKPRYEIYERKRSTGYLKIKNAKTYDTEVLSWEYGERDTKFSNKVGAIVIDFNGVKVSVSSGLTDAMREDGDALVGRLVEIGYHEETPDGSLRHPILKRFRDTLKKGAKE